MTVQLKRQSGDQDFGSSDAVNPTFNWIHGVCDEKLCVELDSELARGKLIPGPNIH